jgi:hypothetical protein
MARGRHSLWHEQVPGWLVKNMKITPHIPVRDKSDREDAHVLTFRLPLGQEARPLHLPQRPGAENQWHHP